MISLEELDALDPIKLKWAYDLTYEELAEALGLRVRIVKYWGSGEKQPTNQIKVICAVVHKEFQRRGMKVKHPEWLVFEQVA